jgi:hypothetical protein
MKILTALLIVAAPAAAQAMGMKCAMPGGGCGSGAGTHFAVGLYALLAALGYWVLQHSAKEAAGYVKRTGQALGWILAVVGLLGVLCGVAGHGRRMAHKTGRCGGAEMTEPAKMGDMSEMRSNCPMKGEMAKKPEAAPKKK